MTGSTVFIQNNCDRPISDLKPVEKSLRKIVLFNSKVSDFNISLRFSSFLKLQRVIAYCIRFINNCKKAHPKTKEFLSINELKIAHNIITAFVQKQEFSDEINVLRNGKPIRKSSSILSLDLFLILNRI